MWQDQSERRGHCEPQASSSQEDLSSLRCSGRLWWLCRGQKGSRGRRGWIPAMCFPVRLIVSCVSGLLTETDGQHGG